MKRFHPLWVLLLLLSACTLNNGSQLLEPWRYTDLRLIDPPDAVNPTQDLIAVYMRSTADHLQIRLDFLDGVEQQQADVYLAIDTAPGGTSELPSSTRAQLKWDTLVIVSASGELAAADSKGRSRPDLSLFVLRDPFQDALYIEMDLQALSSNLASYRIAQAPRLQVFVIEPGVQQVIDQSEPARLDASPPPPARALLAFWDTYMAYTPATALRRWDGAHTGPWGGRHGLYNLLRTARAAGVPLALMDLKYPASLSALDYAGGLALVDEMEREGLLILPQSLPDSRFSPFSLPEQLIIPWLDQIEKTTQDFNLRSSPFIYLPSEVNLLSDASQIQSGGKHIFLRTCFWTDQPTPSSSSNYDKVHWPVLYPQHWRGQIILPLQERMPPEEQVNREGITLEWRQRLIQAAHSANSFRESGYLQMGGSLPTSAWGDPEAARAGFRWLIAHPWIQVLDGAALLTARASQPNQLQPCRGNAPSPAPHVDAAELSEALLDAPPNPIGQAAWQAYQALYAPVHPYPPELKELRARYIGQVWSLLSAASWAQAPSPLATCERDPNRDGQAECLLASEIFYAQFDIENGGLTHFFATSRTAESSSRTQEEAHQMIAPSAQLIVGISDPSSWKREDRSLSDPSVIPGAFFEPDGVYRPSWKDGQLIFTSSDGKTSKSYSLTEQGLRIIIKNLESNLPASTVIPLNLDPWRRFEAGWADQYRLNETGQFWIWEISGGPQIQVWSSTSLSGSDFERSRALFGAPENPNQDFPLGHFKPFPLALVEIRLAQSTTIEIQIALQR